MNVKSLSIGRVFRFSAAHSLTHHNGLCKFLHGHNYRLEIEFQGPKFDLNELGETGMIADFSVIKEFMQNAILNELDHHYLNDVSHFLLSKKQVTVENLILYITKVVNDVARLEKHWFTVSKVRLYETDDCYAEVILE